MSMPFSRKPVKIKFEPGEDGGSVRISRRSGLEIPKPEYKRVGLEDRSKYEGATRCTPPNVFVCRVHLASPPFDSVVCSVPCKLCLFS